VTFRVDNWDGSFLFPSKFEDSERSRLRRMHAEYFEFASCGGDCTSGNARVYINNIARAGTLAPASSGLVNLMIVRREPCDSRQISSRFNYGVTSNTTPQPPGVPGPPLGHAVELPPSAVVPKMFPLASMTKRSSSGVAPSANPWKRYRIVSVNLPCALGVSL
jgi:hypothetical protein